jgi:hypothetical protein
MKFALAFPLLLCTAAATGNEFTYERLNKDDAVRNTEFHYAFIY